LATNRFNQYGWNAWAYEERPTGLDMTAYILCHVPEVCSSGERGVGVSDALAVVQWCERLGGLPCMSGMPCTYTS